MKRVFVAIFLLLIFSACATAPAGGLGRCNQGLCVKLSAEGPFHYGEPVSMTVLLTSDVDREVTISLSIPKNLMIEQPKSPNDTAVDQPTQGHYSWKPVQARANISKTITFKTVFSNEDVYQVVVYADAKNLIAHDEIQIDYSKTGISVYSQGTPVPARRVP